MKRRKLVAVALSLALAGVAAVVPSAGCNGTGVTPVCDFPDGAYDPESGCGQAVEAAVPEDAPEDQGSQGTEDASADTNPPSEDASDGGHPSEMDATDAADVETVTDADAGEHDAHIADAHADAKD